MDKKKLTSGSEVATDSVTLNVPKHNKCYTIHGYRYLETSILHTQT